MRPIKYLLLALALLTGGMLHAQSDRDGTGERTTAPAAETSIPPSGQSKRRESKPADTFKPSEKIGADSAVSFPVDI